MGGTESVTSAWSVLGFKASQVTCFKREALKPIFAKSVSILLVSISNHVTTVIDCYTDRFTRRIYTALRGSEVLYCLIYRSVD